MLYREGEVAQSNYWIHTHTTMFLISHTLYILLSYCGALWSKKNLTNSNNMDDFVVLVYV